MKRTYLSIMCLTILCAESQILAIAERSGQLMQKVVEMSRLWQLRKTMQRSETLRAASLESQVSFGMPKITRQQGHGKRVSYAAGAMGATTFGRTKESKSQKTQLPFDSNWNWQF